MVQVKSQLTVTARGSVMPSFTINLASQWLGTLYTAAVSVGLTFVLGRVLRPEGFGNYSYILTLATLFIILQDGGFKTLLFREKTFSTPALAGRSNRIFSWALGHTLMVTLAGAFLVLALPHSYRVGLATAFLCFGFQAVVGFISSELRGAGFFRREAIWQTTARTFGAIGMLLALFLVRREPGAIFGGWSVGLMISLLLSPRPISRPGFGGLGVRDIRKACLSFMAIDAATTVYYRCDIILLEHLAGTEEVGYYAAAYRFLDGIILLAAPIGIIWFRKLRLVWKEKGLFRGQVVKMYLLMLGVASLIVAVGIPFSRDIVVLTFGNGYVDSARVLPWLLGALVFVLPNGILTQAAIAKNIERLYAVAAVAAAIVNIGLNMLLIPKFGGLGAAWATIATEGFLMVALLLTLAKRIKRAD